MIHECVTEYLFGIRRLANNTEICVQIWAGPSEPSLLTGAITLGKDAEKYWAPFISSFTRSFPMFNFFQSETSAGVQVTVIGE
jgi:hypothetical protein